MSTSAPQYFIGLDLGQAQDPTSLAVIERHGDTKTGICHVSVIKHYSMGTSYTAVVEHLAMKMKSAPAGTILLIDGTGVGRAVTDMVFAHPTLQVFNSQIHAVTITAGNSEARVGHYWKVPKRNLVGAVQVLLQSQRLKIGAGLPEMPLLVAELRNFKVKITNAGNDTYGEWRVGKHDDLVLAVAMGCWAAIHQRINETL